MIRFESSPKLTIILQEQFIYFGDLFKKACDIFLTTSVCQFLG